MATGRTTAGRYFETNDSELTFVYGYSSKGGGVFGLDMQSQPGVVRVRHNLYDGRIIDDFLLREPLTPVEFVPSLGDASSHGATWGNLARTVTDFVVAFRGITDHEREAHVSLLRDMATEGNVRDGGGWATIATGLQDAEQDLLRGFGWRQEHLFEGLGFIAAHFEERQGMLESALAV